MVTLWLLPDWVEALRQGAQVGDGRLDHGRDLRCDRSGVTLIFNADVLLGGLSATVGRIRTLTPVLRMAIAYPLRNQFHPA